MMKRPRPSVSAPNSVPEMEIAALLSGWPVAPSVTTPTTIPVCCAWRRTGVAARASMIAHLARPQERGGVRCAAAVFMEPPEERGPSGFDRERAARCALLHGQGRETGGV